MTGFLRPVGSTPPKPSVRVPTPNMKQTRAPVVYPPMSKVQKANAIATVLSMTTKTPQFKAANPPKYMGPLKVAPKGFRNSPKPAPAKIPGLSFINQAKVDAIGRQTTLKARQNAIPARRDTNPGKNDWFGRIAKAAGEGVLSTLGEVGAAIRHPIGHTQQVLAYDRTHPNIGMVPAGPGMGGGSTLLDEVGHVGPLDRLLATAKMSPTKRLGASDIVHLDKAYRNGNGMAPNWNRGIALRGNIQSFISSLDPFPGMELAKPGGIYRLHVSEPSWGYEQGDPWGNRHVVLHHPDGWTVMSENPGVHHGHLAWQADNIGKPHPPEYGTRQRLVPGPMESLNNLHPSDPRSLNQGEFTRHGSDMATYRFLGFNNDPYQAKALHPAFLHTLAHRLMRSRVHAYGVVHKP
jgi:hypothetical protein